MRAILPALLLTGAAVPARAQDCPPYEPAEVTLTGTLSTGHGYGPPGFGEDPKHDRKESFALVTLDRSACVTGGTDTNEDVAAIRAFQLVTRDGALRPQAAGPARGGDRHAVPPGQRRSYGCNDTLQRCSQGPCYRPN